MLATNLHHSAFKGVITVTKYKDRQKIFRQEYETTPKQDMALKPFLMKCISDKNDPYCPDEKEPGALCPTTSIQMENRIYDMTGCPVSMHKDRQVSLQKDGSLSEDDMVFTFSDIEPDDRDGTIVVIEDLF